MDTRLGGHSANHLSPMVWARAHMGQNVRISGRRFENPFERSRILSNVQTSGRTFEILAERSKFRPNVRISDPTFEFLVKRSEKWKLKKKFEAQKRASRILRWSKMDLLNTNFNTQRSKKVSIVEKRPKMTKNIFHVFPIFNKQIQKPYLLYGYGGILGGDSPPDYV